MTYLNDSEIDDLFGEDNVPSRMATARAVSVIDSDPESMARSIQLSRVSGVAPEVIHGDLEEFERNSKARLVGEMIRNSPSLQEYVNNYGPGAAVSHDDFHNMQEMYDTLGQHGVIFRPVTMAIEKAKEGWITPDFEKNEKDMAEFAKYLGMDYNDPAQRRALERSLVARGRSAFQFLAAVFSSGIKGAAGFIGGFAPPEETKRIEKEADAMISWWLNRGDMGTIKPRIEGAKEAPKYTEGLQRQAQGGPRPTDLPAIPEMISRELDVRGNILARYIESGEVPPAGVMEDLDKVYQRLAGEDVKVWREAVNAVKKTKTLERSVEAMQEALRPVVGDRKVGISPEGIRELYQDKLPEPGDGMLGDIPGVREQIGPWAVGDVQVPLADLLIASARNPEMSKLLEPHLRQRAEGMTEFEAKTPRAVEGEVLAQADEPKVKLERNENVSIYGVDKYIEGETRPVITKEERAYNFEVNGKKGELIVEPQEGGKHLHVRWVGAGEEFGTPNILGKAGTRGLLNAIRDEFPEAETIGGNRNSGARGRETDVRIKLPERPEREVRSLESAVRAETGLEPLADVGKPVRLKYSSSTPDPTEMLPGKPAPIYHTYNLMDGRKKIGHISGRFDDASGTFFVKLIETEKIGGPNSIGPRAVRDIFAQLQEEFPGMKKVMGYRVSGAREKAGKEDFASVSFPASPQKLAEFVADIKGWDKIEAGREIESVKPGTIVDDLGNGTRVEYRPSQFWDANETKIVDAVEELLQRIAPDLEFAPVDKVFTQGGGMAAPAEVQGFYNSGSKRDQIKAQIVVAMVGPRAVGTALHEVIHHLRSGFFSAGEWFELERAAKAGNWIKKHDIDTRYPTAPEWLKLEEAIAEEYKYYASSNLMKSKYSPETLTVFQKLDELWKSIKAVMKAVFGAEGAGIEHIFDRVSSGEVGARTPSGVGGARFKSLNRAEVLAQAARDEEASLFSRAQTFGYTKPQFDRYLKKMDAQREELDAKAAARAERQARQKETALWREHEPQIRQEITEQVNQRPDILADEYFRRGVINGAKVGKMKLNSEFLTDEQKSSLGPGMHGKNGVDPEVMAPVFGFPSGEAMVNGLVALAEARGKISGQAWKNKLITTRVDQLMEERFGSQIADIQAIRDDIISTTAMDMLHDETVALGQKIGQVPATKEQMKTALDGHFAELPKAKAGNRESYIRAAGRYSRMAEDALFKGDFIEAFRSKQAHEIALGMAARAKQFAMEEEAFDKLAKKYSAREVTGRDQAFTTYIQDLLQKAGLNVRLSPAELQTMVDFQGQNLRNFVGAKTAEGWDLQVADRLQDGNVMKFDDNLRAGDAKEFMDSIKSLDYISSWDNKIQVMNRTMDFNEFKKGVIENIESLPVRDKTKPQRAIFSADATMVRMEELMKDLDLRQELGPLYRAVIEPMMEAKFRENVEMKEIGEKLKNVGKQFDKKWQKTLSDSIPQNFFTDPYDGVLFDLTREHMINIMLNFGNRSNIRAFTEGYVGKSAAPHFEQNLRRLFDQYATEKDWQYVQQVWDIFEDFRGKSEKLYLELSGVPKKWIEAEPVQTKYGELKGGYYPIMYDRLRSNLNLVEEGRPTTGQLFGPNYTRATTANHYTKERTGYTDKIEFQNTIEQIGARWQQIIHDLSYRKAVMQVNKVVSDSEIRAAIRKHYGMEYEAQLKPWLKDIANHYGQDEAGISWANSVLRRARYNIVTNALGFNLKVIMSPDVGLFNPADIASFLWDREANMKLAYEKSKELPHTLRNMDRDYRERLDQLIRRNQWNDFQAEAIRWAFIPLTKVSQGFRVVTFTKEYKAALTRGMSEAEAAVWADSKVRERHGSSGLPDMPSIMRANEAMKMSTLFYGYFNTMYNWQRQLPGNVRRGEWKEGLANLYGSVLISAFFGAALFNKQAEDDSWFKTIGKAIALQPLSTVVFGRDFANYFMEGNRPTSPLGSLMLALDAAYKDAKNWIQHKPVKKPIQHTATAVGTATGLPLGQIGRTSQFIYDVNTGKQRPRNIFEWVRGVNTGEARLPKQVR